MKQFCSVCLKYVLVSKIGLSLFLHNSILESSLSEKTSEGGIGKYLFYFIIFPINSWKTNLIM